MTTCCCTFHITCIIGLSVGQIAGIVIGIMMCQLMVCFIMIMMKRMGSSNAKKKTMDRFSCHAYQLCSTNQDDEDEMIERSKL